ncbi:MAG: hypothetical protein NUV77_04485 [Thermoguttaceae bacterium]|jgi:hypothetical protein|nr:hypothetical protein [Thermoguttaceae bacterium]
MDETRESRLAAILVRGLVRVRHTAQRTGHGKPPGDTPPTTADDASKGDPAPTHDVAANHSGEQQ